TNTPDILPPVIQHGGRPAFKMRVALAATLSSLYGIYSGYELCESAAVAGTEEYLGSEKYEIKVRDWDAPGHIKPYLARLNQIRRDNQALTEYRNLSFHNADDDRVLFYGKRSADGSNLVWVVVNLDPFGPHDAQLTLPLAALGLPGDAWVEVHELLT